MNLFKAWFAWDRGCGMFMKGSVMAGQIKVFMDADFLVTEDWSNM